MEMAKMVLFHKLLNENDRPILERWFNKYHVPEVMQQTPWMVRYALFRPVPPPPGAEDMNVFNFRVHENWALDPGFRRPPGGTLSMTPEPGDHSVEGIGIQVPGAPTEDFCGWESCIDDHPILRWVCMFSYPEGVSQEEGDDWYINVHAPEVMQQKGLTRFFSYKACPRDGMLVPHRPRADGADMKDASTRKVYHRLSELWYENNNGWVESNITDPPHYTKPPWGGYDKYPFFEPGVDFACTFLLERPEAVYTQSSAPIVW